MSTEAADELVGPTESDLHRIADELTRRFCPPLLPEVVQRCVLESAIGFEQASVRTYLAILVQRTAAARLRELVANQDDVVGPGSRGADDVPRHYVGPAARAS
jgi:hypothetical protein